MSIVAKTDERFFNVKLINMNELVNLYTARVFDFPVSQMRDFLMTQCVP